MPKKYSDTPIGETTEIAKQLIDSGKLEFYMRTKDQEEYNPAKIKFTDEKYRIPYVLRDMAALCTSTEVAYFVSDIARRMTHKHRDQEHYNITQEELDYVIKFIRNGMKEYKKSKYIELSKLV